MAMEGVVEGDGIAEGSDNLNLIPSTSSSANTNTQDLATSSTTPSNTNPSSSGTQSGGECYTLFINFYFVMKNI